MSDSATSILVANLTGAVIQTLLTGAFFIISGVAVAFLSAGRKDRPEQRRKVQRTVATYRKIILPVTVFLILAISGVSWRYVQVFL